VILERLRMRNFRCYESAEINFATDDSRNTTVVLGTNGAGKTSILLALNFVLYGRSAATSDSPLVSNAALRTATEASPATATVTLEFWHQGRPYTLKRSVRGFLRADKFNPAPGQDEVLLTYTNHDGNHERDPLPQQTIEKMLPGPIRTFFLFDGDRIADFTKPGRDRDDKINRAVNDVLHIEALSRAVEHVGRIAAERRRTLERADTPGVDRISSELRLEEAAVANRKERLEQIGEELQQRTERRADLDAELISFNEIAKQAQARKAHEAARQGRVSRGIELRRKLARDTIAALPALMVDKIATARDILSRYKSRHEIPARIADYFLRDLLEHGDCICGRCIDDGTDARARLEKILQSLIPNSLQDIANELAGRLRPLAKDVDARIRDVALTLAEIEENGKEISRLDREVERLGADIDASTFDRAQALNRERMTISQRIETLHADQARAERDADVGTKKVRLLEERLKSETAKRAGQEDLRRVWILARDCADDLQRAKGMLEERLRETLGIEATRILKNLASTDKKYFFSKVRVDSGFLLRVLDNESRDVRSQLSMGETQVSSLAFMLAMTRLGGQQAPLVIDTPLGRLDESVRLNAAHWLPQLTPQLVLLVTDSEYSADVERELASRVGASMVLRPGPTGTTIAPSASISAEVAPGA
jgi:DNA sulfur modification protein DndD